MNSHGDSDLSRLLDDAVSDVHPEGGPEEIRDRARRPSRGRWVPVTLAAAAATAVVLGGGAWLAQRQPANDQPAASPGGTTSPSTSASEEPSQPARTVDATIYSVGATASGPRLFPELRRVTDATGSDLQVAVETALGSGSQDPDYRNPFAGLGASATASVANGAVTIDFAEAVPRPGGMSDQDAQMALQALVWTADTAAKVTGPVTFTVAGAPAGQVLGVDVPTPVDRAGEDAVLSPVLISTPAEGATVPGTFTVEGRAATFEANVVWELKRGEETVRNGFTTAEVCCTLAPYSFEVSAPPGEYTLVVHDTDESDGEGVGITADTKRVVVQ